MPRIAYNNFTGGEVSPTLNASYNLERFPNFEQVMQNMRTGLHGDCAPMVSPPTRSETGSPTGTYLAVAWRILRNGHL